MDFHGFNKEQDLPGTGSGQPMPRLQSMLGQEREQCHISETLKYKRFTINGAGIMATSHKRQASSAKLLEMINTSVKPQAASFKLQAASDKLLDI